MKNQALIFALGTLFFGHVYSSDPLAEQGLGKIPQENGIFASELQRYKVAHYPTYVKTPLKQRNVIKKSLVEINSENAVDITRVFIDSLGEALEDTNTAVGDRLDTAIEQFKATLKEQKVIAGETAKDLINILRQRAEDMFQSPELTSALNKKIKNLKFTTTSLSGKLEPVQREEREVCCEILSCILSTSYDYFQRQQTTNQAAYYYYPSTGAPSNISTGSLLPTQTGASEI